LVAVKVVEWWWCRWVVAVKVMVSCGVGGGQTCVRVGIRWPTKCVGG
jgi:hypothetical protein